MIRKATVYDHADIMRIYDIAKAYMRENGNVTQWQGAYPYPELVMSDIEAGNMYVLFNSDGRISACFGMFAGDDPTYAYIEGSWADSSPYVAVHRVASDGSERGVFRLVFEFVSATHAHIRIDTHKDNKTMQKAVEACGFTHRGTIYVGDGSPRMAYEWSRQK